MPANTPGRQPGLSPAQDLAKRVFDLSLTLPGVLVLLPVLAGIALWVRLDSTGPAFFRQERTGRNGRVFRVWKFRTMVTKQDPQAPQISAAGDPRITRSGAILRRFKLDELPQLFNVIKGEMSLVGPRPEVPKFVALYPADLRMKVLSVRPGITDYAAIEFRNESDLLATAADPETAYVREILPRKLELYRFYVENWSLSGDFKLVLRTLAALF